MSKVRIRFSTDILRRLGEELNPSPDHGIIELVKNSYDANARRCVIRLLSTKNSGGTVEISDNGDGMDSGDISDNWLVLGRSRKSKSRKTRLGRIPSGSKGLGRLAALRMGRSTTLRTRPRSDKGVEYEVTLDWSKYDNAEIVENVPIEVIEKTRSKENKDGSDVVINGLRMPISQWDIKRIARTLILLADPFGDDPQGFEPVLDAPEYKNLERLVKLRYFEEADYHLVANLDSNGKASARVLDWKGKILFEAKHGEIADSRNGDPYMAPVTSLDLWVFILNKAAFQTKSTTLGEVRAWLDVFGGVHLYENGLRVQPYGNPGNDWLDMNLSRVRSPEERPSTNTSIGRVSVTDRKERLLQKTDRSGFIESESFLELRKFSQDALEWMAKRRMEVAEKRRAKARSETAKKGKTTRLKLEEAIKSAPKSSQAELKLAFTAYDRSKQKEVDQLKKEVQLYRTLSTAGITAATFAHESSGNPLKVIINSISAIERRSKKAMPKSYEKVLSKPVESIKSSIDSLSVLGTATLRLLDQSKRRWGRVDIHKVINDVIKTFTPFLEGRSVTVEREFSSGSPYLRGTEAAIESIITNLLNNSLNAFESEGSLNRKVRIETEVDSEIVNIKVCDSGPGIAGINKRYIWLPGQTTQVNGTGLGLTIVRDAVKDLDGDVDAIENGPLGGAEIIVSLPILGK